MYNPLFDEEADKYQILDSNLRFKDELCFSRTLAATLLPCEGSVIRSFTYDGNDHILSISYISAYDAISCLTNVKKFHEVEALYGKTFDGVKKSNEPTKYCYIRTSSGDYKYFFEPGTVESTSDDVDGYTYPEYVNTLEGIPDGYVKLGDSWCLDDGNTVIDVSSFAPGVYLLRIGKTTVKFQKK